MKRSISLFILVILSLIISYHIYYSFKNQEIDYEVEEIINGVNNNSDTRVEMIEKQNNSYIGVLEIPKIKLKKGFYDINNLNNNVNKNIYVLPNSNMPNEDGSTLVIAAHSGNSYLGYFKELNKLDLDDEVRVYYNNKLYTYFVNKIYEMPKNGKITYSKDKDDTMLVLTTCSKNNNQLIVTAKLGKRLLNEQ